MANLHATIGYDHHAGRATRTASRWVSTTAETWGAIVEVDLHRDGDCTVTLADKHGNNSQTLWSGNANEAAKERGGAGFTESRTGEYLEHCDRCRRIMTHRDGQCLECSGEGRP